MASRRRSRESALQMIYQWEVGGSSAERVIEDFFNGAGQDQARPTDRFAEQLFLDVAGQSADLDVIIRRHASGWRVERMARIVHYLLRLGVAELRQGQTPPSIVIDEMLDIGRRFAGDEPVRFVNGILEAVRKECAAASGHN